MIKTNYNPDVLSCLANLSNDEVFTPPVLVNQILDTLPNDLWSNKEAKFLDPVSKTGVFLREIAKRLMVGLEKQIPDLRERINHIHKNQLYGIAITELTSLLSRRSVYCSKIANGKYSTCEDFTNEQGNILYDRVEHSWHSGNCKYCGASQEVYGRGNELETHAYQFIHTDKPEKIFNMKFDVIIGNPPYQLSDSGYGTSAKPIYHLFVSQAKKLNPRFLAMIIPARWYSGGKGLDEFRDSMLKDDRIRQIVDFPEAIDCFPGVQIKGGVCYFLWDRDNPGEVTVTTSQKGNLTSSLSRPLLEKGLDTFIRFNQAVPILHKVRSFHEESFAKHVSSRKPFNLDTLFKGKTKKFNGSITLYQNGGVGYIEPHKITRNAELIDKYKVLIPRAGSGSDAFPHSILGKPFIAEPGTACTETYLVLSHADTLEESKNVISYVNTRFFRFLVLLKKVTQDATSKVYGLVPEQDYMEKWSEEKINKKYRITSEEFEFIKSLIRPMD